MGAHVVRVCHCLYLVRCLPHAVLCVLTVLSAGCAGFADCVDCADRTECAECAECADCWVGSPPRRASPHGVSPVSRQPRTGPSSRTGPSEARVVNSGLLRALDSQQWALARRMLEAGASTHSTALHCFTALLYSGI